VIVINDKDGDDDQCNDNDSDDDQSVVPASLKFLQVMDS